MDLHDARILARELMDRHGLAAWSFRFDHARRRFGSCRCAAKVITLSRLLALLNDQDQVRETILHEIAHALTPGNGHGAKWRARCREIGARPVRCYDDAEVASPARRAARFQIGCKICDWWADRHRITRRKLVCRTCRSPVAYRRKMPQTA